MRGPQQKPGRAVKMADHAPDLPVVPICRDSPLLISTPNQQQNGHIPSRSEGRFAIVTDVGCGMRWTRMVLLTRAPDADGEVVWS